MKINISQERNINILNIEGDLIDTKAKALSAGIVQMFRNGKNRIIIQGEKIKEIDKLGLQELIKLNQSAKELDGELVIVASSQSPFFIKLKSFSHPHSLQVFKDKTEALNYFYPEEPEKILPKSAPPVSVGSDETWILRKKIESLFIERTHFPGKKEAEEKIKSLEARIQEFEAKPSV